MPDVANYTETINKNIHLENKVFKRAYECQSLAVKILSGYTWAIGTRVKLFALLIWAEVPGSKPSGKIIQKRLGVLLRKKVLAPDLHSKFCLFGHRWWLQEMETFWSTTFTLPEDGAPIWYV